MKINIRKDCIGLFSSMQKHILNQKTINMVDYLDNFDSNGIYTLKEYNNKIKNINDLKIIFNDHQLCLTIFNSMNSNNNGNNNEGKPITLMNI